MANNLFTSTYANEHPFRSHLRIRLHLVLTVFSFHVCVYEKFKHSLGMSDKIDGNGNDNHHDDGNDLSAGKGVIRYIYI